MLNVEFTFVASSAQRRDTLDDTLIENGDIALQNRQTERGIQQFPLLLPSVSYEERIKFYDNGKVFSFLNFFLLLRSQAEREEKENFSILPFPPLTLALFFPLDNRHFYVSIDASNIVVGGGGETTSNNDTKKKKKVPLYTLMRLIRWEIRKVP